MLSRPIRVRRFPAWRWPWRWPVSGQRDAAIEQARSVLQSIEPTQDPIEPGAETDLTAWDLPTYPVRFDDLRVEWERAAWLHAGNPAGEVAAKRGLVRWRLHALLADLTDELVHYEAAVAAFPGSAVRPRGAWLCPLPRRPACRRPAAPAPGRGRSAVRHVRGTSLVPALA